MRTDPVFIVSLDFELAWGVHEHPHAESYTKGARNAVYAILQLFNEYGIHATWATVGLLFAKNKDEIHQYLPKERPSYNNPSLSPYRLIDHIAGNENEAPNYYADSLIHSIRSVPYQEVASHTFSHYYAMEPGQTKEQLVADLQAARSIAESKGMTLRSLVFPKNQCGDQLLPHCAKLGFKAYRGNQSHPIYQARPRLSDKRYHRALRLLDSYFNLTGNHTYPMPENRGGMLNLPASHFLRPCGRKINVLDRLRLQRICRSMKHAAMNNQVYHLWWHPHNFGAHLETNISFLKSILDYFNIMQSQYGMQSMNMAECTESACNVSS